MLDRQVITQRYFARPSFSFFRWMDDGDVIAWESGQTIAFKEELQHVLAHLAADGLPPMEAVVMLMAACRNGWHLDLEEVRSFRFVGEMVRPDWIDEILEGLETVNNLDSSLRSSVQGKALIAEVVFERSKKKLNAAHSQVVVDELARGLWNDVLTEGSSPNLKTGDMLPMLDALYHGLPHISDELLKNRRDTGLDELVEPTDVDIMPADRARQLIADLADDDQLRGVGRIAQDLMAAVHVPRTVNRMSELPVGGVSDITNRGELDRLLASELANDDLMLAVRVASNEALYLRREAPPSTPPKLRAVLVDTNLRLWGVPRVFAASVALALIATGDKHCAEYCCYRTRKRSIEAVDLLCREGLVDLLGTLNAERHPAASLELFLEQVAELHADALLVTSQDTWADDDFRLAIIQRAEQPFYVATVSRTGQFRMHSVAATGTSLMNEAIIQLDHLNDKPAQEKRQSLLRADPTPDQFPAIYRADPFPLRLAYPVDVRTTWAVRSEGRDDVLMLTRDGLLLLFDEENRKGIQLSDRLPSCRLRWRGIDARDGVTMAVTGSFQKTLQLLRIDLKTPAVSTLELEYGPDARGLQTKSTSRRDTWQARGVFMADGVVVLVFRRCLNILNASTGEMIRSQRLPEGMRWHAERIFHQSYWSWYRMSYDGDAVRFQEINGIDNHGCIDVFECVGVDGVIGVNRRGDVYFSSTGKTVTTQPLDRVIHSADGSTLVINGPYALHAESPRRRWAYYHILATQDLQPLNWASVDAGRVLDRPVYDLTITSDARRNIERIGVTVDGKLCLLHGEAVLTLELIGEPGRFRWHRQVTDKLPVKRIRVLNPAIRPEGSRVRLRKAYWSEAGEAFVDGRGLLHLKSNNPAIPELTISLVDHAPSGWTSDGRLFGATQGLHGQRNATDREILTDIIEPFLKPLT